MGSRDGQKHQTGPTRWIPEVVTVAVGCELGLNPFEILVLSTTVILSRGLINPRLGVQVEEIRGLIEYNRASLPAPFVSSIEFQPDWLEAALDSLQARGLVGVDGEGGEGWVVLRFDPLAYPFSDTARANLDFVHDQLERLNSHLSSARRYEERIVQ